MTNAPTTTDHRNVIKRKMKLCPDGCGKLVLFISKRCRSCANLKRWSDGSRPRKAKIKCPTCDGFLSDKRSKQCKACRLDTIATKCIDCKKRIYRESTRCQSCATKNLWRNEEFANKIRAKLRSLPITRRQFSSLEVRYLEVFANYGFQWQQEIAGYKPDFCHRLHRVIVEIFGDYWHCHPATYAEDFFHPELKMTAREIREKDAKRITDLRQHGYKVHVIWERELNDKGFLINDFLESLNLRSNLLPEFKGMTTQEVVDKIAVHRKPYAVAMEHWQGDFNFSTLCRNANALGAREVFYIGKRGWNKKGAVGTQYYTTVKFLTSYGDLEKLKKQYVFVGVDNVSGSVAITNFTWPVNSLMVFGEENKGLTPKTLGMCDHVVDIPMCGSVRSLNAGCASSIAMYDYCKSLGL
jgi:tRNA G18 (ribose-2'-O)-methylase SpoU